MMPKKRLLSEQSLYGTGIAPASSTNVAPAVNPNLRRTSAQVIEKVNAPVDQGSISQDTRGLFQRGVDAVSNAYRKNVPESFKTIVPGFSDVEDALYLRDAIKERNLGQIALATGALALPIVGSKALKRIDVDSIAKRFSDKYGSEITVKNDPKWDNHIDLSFYDGDEKIGNITGEVSGNDIKMIGAGVPEQMRRKGIASNMYRTLNEEAMSQGGVVKSSGPFGFTLKDPVTNRSIAPAREMWDNLVSQGEAEKIKGVFQYDYKMLPLGKQKGAKEISESSLYNLGKNEK